MRSRQQRVGTQGNVGVFSCLYMQLWERQSCFVEESEKWMWDDVTPSMMSDEGLQGNVRHGRAIDLRANSSFKQSAQAYNYASHGCQGTEARGST